MGQNPNSQEQNPEQSRRSSAGVGGFAPAGAQHRHPLGRLPLSGLVGALFESAPFSVATSVGLRVAISPHLREFWYCRTQILARRIPAPLQRPSVVQRQ